MSGQSRINIVALLCTCVTQAAILGGFLVPYWTEPPHRIGPERSTTPLVVELLPLDGADRSTVEHRPAEPKAHETLHAADGRDLAGEPLGSAARPATKPAESAAPTPAAAPTSEARSAAFAPAELSSYQRRLHEVVARNSRYPVAARRQHLSGVTQLAFRLDRFGNVLDSWINQSSGSDILDDAALEALERAQPLPPIPPSLPGQMEFVIEIDSSAVQQLGG
jgi:protein TonB